jgi:hypothetical protein
MNYSVVEQQISLFIPQVRKKFPNKSSERKSYVQHGALMAKQLHSVQLVELFLSDQEIYKKSIKLSWKHQSGACNGVLSQASMINRFV